MAERYFNSSEIKVFPSSRRQSRPSSIYTSEENLTNLIKASTDIDSYVDSYKFSNNSLELNVVIDGYYFRITTERINDLFGSSNFTKYLSIKKSDDGSGVDKFSNLSPISGEEMDSNNNFMGLLISDSPIDNSPYLLLSGNSSEGFTLDESCSAKYLNTHVVYDLENKERIPKITSKPKSEVASGDDYPKNPKKGDIFIIYQG